MTPIDAHEFGDTELRFISFDADQISINVFDASDFNFIRIDFNDVLYFWMATNFPQNVIESISLVEIKDLESQQGLRERLLSAGLYDVVSSNDAHCVIFTPVAGPDILVVCKSYSVLKEF